MVQIIFGNHLADDHAAKIVLSNGKETNWDSFLSDREKKILNIKSADINPGCIETFDTADYKIVLAKLKENSSALHFEILGGKLYQVIKKQHSAEIYISDDLSDTLSKDEIAYHIALGIELASYRFDKYLTKCKEQDLPKLETVIFSASEKLDAKGYDAFNALATGVRYARDLTNEPSNNMTPVIMAADIKRLEYLGLEVQILDENQMQEKEFNLALSVARGSANAPRIAIITWRGKAHEDGYDLGLVGKGVTFDSGGISLKPANGMWDMKQDMAGAAAVVGAMKTAAMQKLPINVVAIVGLVENMPSGTATRPGDIVRSMSGQTVEILNTDAEGRLVLADCLWYIQQNFNVSRVADIATLTGAIMVALGTQMAGIMGNNQEFIDLILSSGKVCGENFWQLPISEEYNKMMDSDIADMKNISESRNAGSITAACFLNRFILEKTQWAHLDIAGMDKESKGKPLYPKGATGFGVRAFNSLMKNLIK